MLLLFQRPWSCCCFVMKKKSNLEAYVHAVHTDSTLHPLSWCTYKLQMILTFIHYCAAHTHSVLCAWSLKWKLFFSCALRCQVASTCLTLSMYNEHIFTSHNSAFDRAMLIQEAECTYRWIQNSLPLIAQQFMSIYNVAYRIHAGSLTTSQNVSCLKRINLY